MKIFKTSFLILLRNFRALIIYLAIFFGLTITMGKLYAKQIETGFVSEKPEYTIVNEDRDCALYEGMAEFLGQYGIPAELDTDLRSLQDGLFYEDTRYILRIPEGFADGILSGEDVQMDETMKKDAADGYLLSAQVNQYWNMIRNCREMFPDLNEEQLKERALNSLAIETQVTLSDESRTAAVPDIIYATLRVVVYMAILISIYLFSTLQIAFYRTDLNLRNLCAPVSATKKHLQIALSGVIAILLVCTGMMAVISVIYNEAVTGMDGTVIRLLVTNFLLLILNSIAIAMVVSMFTKSVNVQNLAGNFISLAMAFLCGAFVPLEYLDASVKTIGKFLPPYWYCMALEKINTLQNPSSADIQEINSYMLVQLGFAAAIFAVALLIGKYQGRDEDAIVRNRTEMV